MLYGLVNWYVSQCSEQTTGHHQFLSPDFVGERAEEDQKWRADDERSSHYDVSRARIDLEYGLQIEKGIKLRAVRHHALPSGGSKQ